MKLTLAILFPGRLPPAALRQGPVQEQAGAQPGVRHLAPDAGHRHLRGLRHPAAGGLTAAAAGRTLHRVLQVPRVWGRGQAGRGGRPARRRVRVRLLRKPLPSAGPVQGPPGAEGAPGPRQGPRQRPRQRPRQGPRQGPPEGRGAPLATQTAASQEVEQEAGLHGRALGGGELGGPRHQEHLAVALPGPRRRPPGLHLRATPGGVQGHPRALRRALPQPAGARLAQARHTLPRHRHRHTLLLPGRVARLQPTSWGLALRPGGSQWGPWLHQGRGPSGGWRGGQRGAQQSTAAVPARHTGPAASAERPAISGLARPWRTPGRKAPCAYRRRPRGGGHYRGPSS